MTTPLFLSPEEELAAWNTWKKICFVDGCPPAVRSYLQRRIVSKMLRLLVNNGALERRDCLNSNGQYGPVSDHDIIQAFDLFRASKDQPTCADQHSNRAVAPEQSHGLSRRQYKEHKDFVWAKIGASADPPMKVINGMLLGPRGMINEVCNDLIESYFPAFRARVIHQESQKTVRRFFYAQSIDQQVADNDARTLGDMIVDELALPPDQAAAENDVEYAYHAHELIAILSQEEIIILLAMLHGIKASAAELCKAVGRQKTTCCRLAAALPQKLSSWLAQSSGRPAMNVSFFLALRAVLVHALQEQSTHNQNIRDFLAMITALPAAAQ